MKKKNMTNNVNMTTVKKNAMKNTTTSMYKEMTVTTHMKNKSKNDNTYTRRTVLHGEEENGNEYEDK